MDCNIPHDRYNLLVEFAVKHMDFQQAELESVLDMYGIRLNSPDCQVVPLPNASNGRGRSFLILSFPYNISGKRYYVGYQKTEPSQQPIATILMSRCILVRSVLELWGIGIDIDSCIDCARQWKESPLGKTIYERNAAEEKTWKTTIHTLGTKYNREEQDAMRNKFSFFSFRGPVRMEAPDNEFILIREIELTALGSAVYPRHDYQKKLIPEHDARPPFGVYFGRILATRSLKGRGGVEQYSLKKRVYLGPTSMDAELSFIMTNLGQVEKGNFVMDPFVGTGSILLSSAIRGAYCMGTDIDLRVLRGRSKEENVCSNFAQLGLPRPELVRSDNALYSRHYRRSTVPMYDAIVTDPPYGIRAGARQTGSRLDQPRAVLEEHRHDHIAQTKPYSVSDVMSDLVDMAARTLVMGGRLVYVIPSFSTDFSIENDLPQHACLELMHSCYQPFTVELGRRIVTMKKISAYEESQIEAYLASVWKNGPESAEKCANIRDKILEAAKKKPDYERKAAFRKEKRKKHREEKKQAKFRRSESTEDK
jgi:tRNA (guanine10-N2)-methyltransferase